jgi:hypothetical protein
MPESAGGISYVLPLRWTESGPLSELAAYLHEISDVADEIVVVDGSPPERFAAHALALAPLSRHIPPDPALGFQMGKVDGVITGVLAARHERVVIADDDVRYSADSLARVAALLDEADLVRPQNHFDPLPWHARLDTARTLLNRVHSGDPEFGSGDFPGTLAVRRSTFEAIGGYDGDVMFENLELMRTVSAAGGRVVTPLDLYVRRLPPSTRHFGSQRVRQAYDDFGVPLRMAAFLSVIPVLIGSLFSRRRWVPAAGAAALAITAEAGRRRAGGTRFFPLSSSLLAPLWVLERSLSAWLAVLSRFRHGGIRYAGSVIRRSVNSPRELRRRAVAVSVPARLGAEPGDLVGAVAERMDPRAPAAAERDRAPT